MTNLNQQIAAVIERRLDLVGVTLYAEQGVSIEMKEGVDIAYQGYNLDECLALSVLAELLKEGKLELDWSKTPENKKAYLEKLLKAKE